MDINKATRLAYNIINHRNKGLGFKIVNNFKDDNIIGQCNNSIIYLKKSFIENNNRKMVKDIILHELIHDSGSY